MGQPSIRQFLPFFLLVILSSGCGWNVITGPATLVSRDLRITIDGADLKSIKDTAGNELLSRPQPLFRISFIDHAGKYHTLDSRGAENVHVERKDDVVRATFDGFKPIGPGRSVWSAAVRLNANIDEDGVGCTVRIECGPADGHVVSVDFPVVQMPSRLGERHADDRFLLSGGDGVLVRARGIQRRNSSVRDYPGHMSMQLLAYYDDSQGLSVQCHDDSLKQKKLGYRSRGGKLDIVVQHLKTPDAGICSIETAPIKIYATKGHWMNAARHYRKWALGSKFGNGPLDRPAWTRQAPFLLHGEFRETGNGKYVVPLDRWGEVTERWHKFTGARSVYVDFRHWEHGAIYSSPDYFPLHPSNEAVAGVMKAVHAKGHKSMAMVAGMKWLIERKEHRDPAYMVHGYEGRERFEREGKPVCIVNRDGTVWEKKPWTTWDGTKSYICPGTAFARKLHDETSAGLAKVGFDLYEFDQMNGGRSEDCYSTKHGHPPGPGAWKSKAVYEIVRSAREKGRAINPDYATALEDPAEFLLPVLDVYFGRQNNFNSWPAFGDGTEVVPAFTYVYHTVNSGGTLDNRFSKRPDSYAFVRMARSFIWGRWLGGHLQEWELLRDHGADDMIPWPERMNAKQAEMMRNLVRTQAGPGFNYLINGKMLWCPAPDVSDFEFLRVDWKGGKKNEFKLKCPSVLASAWEHNGNRAFFFVNMSGEKQAFMYSFEAENFKPDDDAAGMLYVNGHEHGSRKLGLLKSVEVPARSVVVVEFGTGSPE